MTKQEFAQSAEQLYLRFSASLRQFPLTNVNVQSQTDLCWVFVVNSMVVGNAIFYLWLDKDGVPHWGQH